MLGDSDSAGDTFLAPIYAHTSSPAPCLVQRVLLQTALPTVHGRPDGEDTGSGRFRLNLLLILLTGPCAPGDASQVEAEDRIEVELQSRLCCQVCAPEADPRAAPERRRSRFSSSSSSGLKRRRARIQLPPWVRRRRALVSSARRLLRLGRRGYGHGWDALSGR